MKNRNVSLLLRLCLVTVVSPVVQCSDTLSTISAVGSAGKALIFACGIVDVAIKNGVWSKRACKLLPRFISNLAIDATAAGLAFYPPKSKDYKVLLNVVVCAGVVSSLKLDKEDIVAAIEKGGTAGAGNALLVAFSAAQIIVSARQLYQLATEKQADTHSIKA